MKMTYREKIKSIADDRDVRLLLHFTQAANLLGIVKHGLLSRRKLAELESLDYYVSDQYRLDESEDAVSISISRFNEDMFASKRYKSGHSDWIVLALSPDILWTHNCRFCWRNAAKKEIKDHRGWRCGPWAFAEMFAGSNEVRSGLARCYPSDPEAEVQVLEPIASEYILGAIVDRPEMVEPVQKILNGLLDYQRQVLVSRRFLIYPDDHS